MSYFDDLVKAHKELELELTPLMAQKAQAIIARQDAVAAARAIADQTNPLESQLAKLNELIALGEDRLIALQAQNIEVSASIASASMVSEPRSKKTSKR